MSIPRHHAKGTAIVMAVGLLVLLAMLGAAFVVVTHMDRKEALSLQNAEPMKTVAASILEKILANRAEDMPGPATPNADIDYPQPSPAGAPWTEKDIILSSTEPVWDATNSRLEWPHLSDMEVLGKVANGFGGQANPVGANLQSVFFVDASGERFYFDASNLRVPYSANAFSTVDNNALSYDSGMRDAYGRPYFVAVRVVDASAFMNANLAGQWQNVVPGQWQAPQSPVPGQTINVTNVPLVDLLGQILTQATPANGYNGSPPVVSTLYNSIHSARSDGTATPPVLPVYYANYGLSPFWVRDATNNNLPPNYLSLDLSDLLGMVGGSSANRTGRLFYLLGGNANNNWLYDAARPYLTTWSANRLCGPGRSPIGQKVDLNNASFSQLMSAFDAMAGDMKGLYGWNTQDLCDSWAAQMACNVMEFRSPDGPPTVQTVTLNSGATATFVGIKRQPFIVEASFAEYRPAPATPEDTYAVELFNPYASSIDLTGYKIRACDPLTFTLQHETDIPNGAVTSLPAHGRLIIYWCGATGNTWPIQKQPDSASVVSEDLTSNPAWPIGAVTFATSEIRIVRVVGTKEVIIGKVKPTDFTNPSPQPPAGGWVAGATGPVGETIARCDDPVACFYAIDKFKKTIGATHLIVSQSPVTSLLGLSKTSAVPVADPIYTGTGIQGVPIYVRNGPLVSLADLFRVMAIGPDSTTALDERLAGLPAVLPTPAFTTDPTKIDNGRLSFLTVPTGASVPNVPVAALISDYFTLNSPAYTARDNDGNAYSGTGSVAGTTLTDASTPAANWAINAQVGKRVLMGVSPAPVQVRKVTANDATHLTLDSAFIGGVGANYVLDPVDDVAYGQININTAPRAVIEALVQSIPNAAVRVPIVNGLLNYRDNPGSRVGTTGLATLRADGASPNGFLTSAEAALPIYAAASTLNTTPDNTVFNNLLLGDLNPLLTGTPSSDDGLGSAGAFVQNDLVRRYTYYAWLSNLLTVRSDTYIAYIRVDTRSDTTAASQIVATRKYVALIDRSNVRGGQPPANVPQVFAANTNQLVDSSLLQPWTPNCWAGAKAEIVAGGGKGQIRGILSNTNNALTVESNWDAPSDANTKYRIYFQPNVLFFSAVN